jgi:uncharacterized protein YjbI with pentapeptide repeats
MRRQSQLDLALRMTLMSLLALGCGDGESTRTSAPEAESPETSRCRPTLEEHDELRKVELPARDEDGVLDLRGWDLSCADLYLADLGEADLRDANLSRAFLWGALLGDASLQGAVLKDANLESARISGADLEGADLTGAVVDGTSFTWTRGVDLVGCPLSPGAKPGDPSAVSFEQCVPTGTSHALIGPRLDLTGADLTGVDGAGIVGARAVDLRGCPTLSDDSGYHCRRQPAADGWAVVGPKMSVLGADFTGIDLAGVKVIWHDPARPGTDVFGLVDCPEELSEGYRCTPLPSGGSGPRCSALASTSLASDWKSSTSWAPIFPTRTSAARC